ncbi:TonB-linked SusC/RagA family outer membrane protein [Chitinophaga terrae (ex Kim and Jung 2007)]|uniref:SusC/RagA family TonB-linked outer membrane protein n=1 Tax=Chitinophaga terrae (ex Kim and Jung 2007) TaxID=408074 RepID=UPI002780DFC6|nr:SusC/RagA family TonB-linked outer membrane protein [Chitinophaga terrae (ex Kim and Jung 2007)]MDQ0106198.1 TonB-linked SusC/RagA family outer membrane protein [Chitinophaga terrae (ex Kim and Jung 2007)]
MKRTISAFRRGMLFLLPARARATANMLVLLLFTLALSAFAEAQKVTLSVKQVPLEQVFTAIRQQTGYYFLYNNDLLKKTSPVSIQVKDADLTTVMDMCIAGQPLAYKIIDRTITLKEANKPATVTAVADTVITGKVTDEKGNPLPGVTIAVEGSARGAVTDASGKYTLQLPAGANALVFSFIGFTKQRIEVNGNTNINVKLAEASKGLSEVVVTALGVKRETKSLGYTVAELKGADLSQGKEANVANALSGKVAGVQVSRPASGAGGSSKVVIRGNNSLVGNSQPLYVIDGVPLDNQNIGAAGSTGGIDFGDGISNINQEDIESISVLKGPNAAALYGQRGSNGVILITTKSGSARKGIGIKFSSDYSIGNALVTPDFQNEYGQGLNGEFTHFRGEDGKIYTIAQAKQLGIKGMPKMSAGRDRIARSSWGAKMEGQTYEDQWGNILQLTPQPNTYKDFFNTEKQRVNNISADGGNEKVNYRFSYSNTHVDGYVPTNTLDRNTFTLRTQASITPKFQLDAKVNYISQKGKNRPTLSDASDNPAYLFISMPRSMPLSVLANDTWTAEDVAKQLGFSGITPGIEKTYATNSSTANPYWTINHTSNTDHRDRVLGMLRLSYDLTKWLKISARGGTDFYTEQRLRWRAKGTYQSTNRNGDIEEKVIRVREDNYDVLLTGNFELNKDFSLGLNAGSSHQKKYLRLTGNTGKEFIMPNLHVINNTLTNSYLFDLQESEINSVYGFGQLSFRNYWFLDFSARNDWSSTLSASNNSFFYPSVSTSVIMTDLLNIRSNAIPFWKIRASVAQAGSSGNPYQLTGAYSLDQFTHGGQPLGYFTSVIPDPNLRNELTTSVEFGTDVKLFNNRLGLSFTYYNASTKNQILDVPLPPSSKFEARRINAGEIRNRGIEVSVNGTPVKLKNGFTWESAFNFSRNRNEVVSLAEGVETFSLGSDRGISVVAAPGKPFGTMVGTGFAWLKDEQGNRLIDPTTGLPLRTAAATLTELGSALPDWTGGFSNTFRYKGISLGALVDIRQGGVVYSQSNREELIYGTTRRTLEGREGGYIASGMLAQKDANGNWVSTGKPNNIGVKAQDYWNVVASDKENVVSEEMINDASYIAMREISLSYQLPAKLFAGKIVKRMGVGLYGRNLFYFQRHTDGFSPEASGFNVNNSSLGLESTSLPMMRNFGVNLSLDF